MNDIIELECVAYKDSDDIGDTIKGETYWKKIYAKRKSITLSEFYQAQSQGLNPELKFELNSFEYDNNKNIRFEGKIYKILRTYESSLDKIEIVCKGIVNNASA
ncbi:phage head closure protein [Clostridium sp. DSM 100503]|uniref:phage head closure protein n=1 Tax=Clostridium sp. DSM 100503 TaxID=2963282 RepID=UPI00214A38F7|nr:phage head closure protein [Clostridium sp. DSM 100503]MCR1953000.1 phage head closure protein [Clostridium sp. DSM 100503]